MVGCPRFGNTMDMLKAGMKARSVSPGLVLESGAYSGRTTNHL
jgi:hypothetical protein